MKILLSIKPEFVKEIFSGNKKFEYRKSIFKKKGIDKVIVYSTKPVGKIIGEFSIEKILKLHPEQLWKETSKFSGISKKKFAPQSFKYIQEFDPDLNFSSILY